LGALVFRLVLPVALLSQLFAATTGIPDTTLSIETGNNTSAASSFQGTSNGNVRASNVSKEPISSLLGPNSTVKFFAHLMPWWGGTGHIDVGYSSHDSAQIRRQVNDMISRGFAGVIVAEAMSNSYNSASLHLLADEVNRHPGFLFAIQLNKRAIAAASDPTAKLISDLELATTEYFGSPNYLRVNGRPVVFFFDGDIVGLDWNRAQAALSENPMFVFRNSSGFTRTASSGAFAWIGLSTSTDPSGLSYLNNFYGTGLNYTSKYVTGSGWKGFDDSLASWGKDRKVPQRCGMTWLETIARAKSYFGAYPGERFIMQVNTWNDYEEGTAIESGIDNCISVSARISGNTLKWSITAPSGIDPEVTISKYLVYFSLDGEKLTLLTEKAVGDRSLNLDSYSLERGTYSFYVKALGKPSIVNKMSSAVTYRVAKPLGNSTSVAKRTITVTSPHQDFSYVSPVLVSATASSPSRITGFKLYIDGVTVASSSIGSLRASVSISRGKRSLTFKAWDATGALWKKNISITVK
jgi:hypothetical protein